MSEKRDTWDETKEYLDALCNADMQRVVSNLKVEIKRLGLENIIFEKFLLDHEPSLIAGMAKAMIILNQMQGQFMSSTTIKSSSIASDSKIDTQSASSGTYSIVGRRVIGKGKGPRINFSQKSDLVLREIEDTQIELKKFQEYSHRQMNKLRAEVEENGIRDAELQETAQNFEQQIVIEAVEELTQKIPAEKFVRYMQEWLKSAQIMLEKLRLRTNSLCTQHRKLKALLIQKEDMGECVHEVDFEKLGIENKNFLEKIEQKYNNLLELKRMNGKASLMLTTHKNFLQKQDEYMNEIQTKIKFINKQYEELQTQQELTELELEKDRKKYDHIKMVISKYQVPDVMEYILKKNELEDNKKRLKVWKRKTNIQKIVMHTYIKIMCQLTNSPKAKSKWYTKKMNTWNEDDIPESMDDMVHEYRSFLKKQKSISLQSGMKLNKLLQN